MNKHLIFVCGTLRRGGSQALQTIFPAAMFVAQATVPGRLYDFGAYPGLLLAGTDSSVVGEVYEIDDATLHALDELEAASHYLRRQVEIALSDRSEPCWVYVFDPQFYAPQVLIATGDWIEYAKMKTA